MTDSPVIEIDPGGVEPPMSIIIDSAPPIGEDQGADPTGIEPMAIDECLIGMYYLG